MVSSVGVLRVLKRYPYIYFIVKGRYLYIGETEKAPVIRWSDHLKGGSFSKNLILVDPEIYNNDLETFFFAYQCEKIYYTTKPEEYKSVTKYIEHLLHVKAISSRLIGPKYEIISDTRKTVPFSCKYVWANRYSEAILELFIEDLCRILNC